ncbi:zinc metalloprotease [Kordiimonas sediminis]|uniref:Zinc metalloprotease n=1 Tax=Kordiimonas sediminis TaxID=1735581 RepID=A0A919AXR4_9PROT|nr:RIP metalloprotease RseP [Kordiimonas sediminis]GHF28486.1 zinc metalloprotease [Kordiimonas sediminis]
METEAPGFFITLVAFIGGFSLLVFIHEWGHYSVARLFKIKVDSFSVGFGKELFGWTSPKTGVRWKIAMLPLGGYVKFFGDKSGASDAGDGLDYLTDEEKQQCLHFKPLYQRALVVAAGPAINLLAAALVFAGFYLINGMAYSEPVVEEILEGSAAEKAGLLPGDRILKVGDREIEYFTDIGREIRMYPGAALTVRLERGGVEQSLPVVIGKDFYEDRFGTKYPYGILGVSTRSIEHRDVGLFESLGKGTVQTYEMSKSIFVTIGQMIMGVRSVKEMGGPVKIVSMTGEAAEQGLTNLIWFLALISVNLGIMNLLPIPVLDGGHLMFYLIEAVKGSPLNKKAQEAGFVAGFALMLIFMLFVTLNDLQSVAL